MLAKARWLGFAAIALLGCGEGDDGRTVIRYMAWGNPQQLALEKRFCEAFMRENPTIRVKFIQTPSSAYRDKMILMLASRTAPDVMRVDRFDFPALVAKAYYHPLDELIAKDPTYRQADYFPVAVQEGKYRGRQYGLNVLFGAPIIYYNKDLLKKAGLEEPYALWKRGAWSWDVYLRYAQTMTTKDAQGKPLSFGSWINGLVFQCATVYSFGGDIMRDGRVCLAEGKAAEAMRFVRDLRFKYKVEPDASQTANSAFSFEGGKIGMQMEWMGVTPRLREAAAFEWDVCPIPLKAGGTTMVKGNQLVMSAESRHPQAAWRFMKFMTGKRTEMKLYADLRRCFPTRKDVAYSKRYLSSGDLPPHHLDAFVWSVEKAKRMPITSRWGEWTTEFNGAVEPLYNGTTDDVNGSLREGQRRANATLDVQEGL